MLIYRNYDQAQLDAQYNNRAAVPDHTRWTERWPKASEEARAQLGGRYDVPYGRGERQTLDIFPVGQKRSPVLIFIHGGYWRTLNKDAFSWIATSYVRAGIAFVAVGYPLCPTVTLDALTESVREAVGWIYRNAATFGGDPARLHISGHSAGGHLTAMMLSTDWAARGLPDGTLKGGCAISGIYDLEPIRLCFLNADVRLTPDMVQRNSPLRVLPSASPPLILTVGGRETDEFQRQQALYGDAWRAAGLPLGIVPAPADQHFSIVDRFADPSHELFQTVRRQISGEP
ncbi:MAG TPA: alpha/beta hydrolase [Alphaproteobacteria bacterium]|nr:alpha/beta hydrolase [Alphaproteobacteria bacterium]